MGKVAVNKTIVEVCTYLQSQDDNGNYMDYIKEIQDGDITEEQTVFELEDLLKTLVSEFNQAGDKECLSKIRKLKS